MDYIKCCVKNVREGYLVSAEPLGNVRYLPDCKDLIGVLCASFYNRLERLRKVERRVCEIQQSPVPGQDVNIFYDVLVICCDQVFRSASHDLGYLYHQATISERIGSGESEKL